MKKQYLKTLLMAATLGLILTSCGENTVNHSGEIISPSQFSYETEEKQFFTVEFPSKQEGYTISGSSKVYYGEDYSFIVKLDDDYDGTYMKVKVNDVLLTSSSDLYTYPNVTENLTISVTDLYKKSYIDVTTTSYSYLLGSISDTDKTEAKYLEGVTGVFQGKPCEVTVDLSKVKFDTAGKYIIKYSLKGHMEISKSVGLVIYSLPTDDLDTHVDLSNYRTCVIPESYGSLFTDYDVIDSNNERLDEYDIKFDSNLHFAYFSGDYISSLPINNTYSYKLQYQERSLNLSVSITDDEAPAVTFSMNSGEYGYFAGTATLPTITLDVYSKQDLSYEWYFNDQKVNRDDIVVDKVGDYKIEIRVYKNGQEYEQYRHVYTYHIVNPVSYFDFGWSGGRFGSIGVSNRGNPTAIFNFGGPQTGHPTVERDTFFFVNYSHISENIKGDQDSIKFVLRTLSLETGDGYDPTIITRKFGSTEFENYNTKTIGVGNTFSVMIKARTASETEQDYSNSIIFRDVVGEFEIVSFEFINHANYTPYEDVVELADDEEFDDYIFRNEANFRSAIKCGTISELDSVNKTVLIADKSSSISNDCQGICFKHGGLSAMLDKGYKSFSFDLKIVAKYEDVTGYGSADIDLTEVCFIKIGAGSINYKTYADSTSTVDGTKTNNVGDIPLSTFSSAGAEVVVKVRTPGGLNGYDFQAQYELSNFTFKK